ncbi:hypothetical protein ACTXT7_002891 [Hymenolepis weldensis]
MRYTQREPGAEGEGVRFCAVENARKRQKAKLKTYYSAISEIQKTIFFGKTKIAKKCIRVKSMSLICRALGYRPFDFNIGNWILIFFFRLQYITFDFLRAETSSNDEEEKQPNKLFIGHSPKNLSKPIP